MSNHSKKRSRTKRTTAATPNEGGGGAEDAAASSSVLQIPENESIRQQLIIEAIIDDPSTKTDDDIIGESLGPLRRRYSSEEDTKADDDDKTPEIPAHELLATVNSAEQSKFSCVDYESDTQSNYHLVFGDLQKWRMYSSQENNKDIVTEDLWFLRDNKSRKQRRRVFVEGKVHRVWNICADDETFEAKLHLFLSWLVTKDEYVWFMQHTENNNEEQQNTQNAALDDITKLWRPIIHLPELVDGTQEFVDTGIDGKFKIVSYKKFAGFGHGPDVSKLNQNTALQHDEKNQFEIKHAKFMRCKVEISGTFHADFNLKHFPFDVQNLKISIMDRSGRGTFLPAFRQRKQFMNVDSMAFEVKEWDLRATTFEFVDANPMYDTQSFGKNLSQLLINFKYVRNYQMYLLQYVSILASLTGLSMLVFTFDFESAADRSGFVVGLVLTIAFTDYQKPQVDYMTILDKYKTFCYFYLMLITMVTAVAPTITTEDVFDQCVFVVVLLLFIAFHVFFALYAYRKHKQELAKMQQTYHQHIERLIEQEADTLDKMKADYTKPISKSGSLAFMAERQTLLK